MKITFHAFLFLMTVVPLIVFAPSSCTPSVSPCFSNMVVVVCLKKATDQEPFDSLLHTYSELLKRHEARTDKGAELVSQPSREHFPSEKGFDHQKNPQDLAQEHLQRYLATHAVKKR